MFNQLLQINNFFEWLQSGDALSAILWMKNENLIASAHRTRQRGNQSSWLAAYCRTAKVGLHSTFDAWRATMIGYRIAALPLYRVLCAG